MTTPHPHHHRSGFTLIEILIVIVIIGLLMAITIPAAISLKERSEISHAKTILQALRGVVDEFQLRTDAAVDHTRNLAGNPQTDLDDTMDTFVAKTQQIETCDKMLRSIGGTSIVVKDASNNVVTINDPWGTELRYASAVSYTTNSFDDSLPVHPRPFFASAGPDKKWGSANPGASEQDKADAEDNIYSFDLD